MATENNYHTTLSAHYIEFECTLHRLSAHYKDFKSTLHIFLGLGAAFDKWNLRDKLR